MFVGEFAHRQPCAPPENHHAPCVAQANKFSKVSALVYFIKKRHEREYFLRTLQPRGLCSSPSVSSDREHIL
jgi:hypothetical protein